MKHLSKLQILQILDKYAKSIPEVKDILKMVESNQEILTILYEEKFENELELMSVLI